MSMWRAAQRDKVSSIFLSFKRAAGKEKYHKSKKKKKQRKEKSANIIILESQWRVIRDGFDYFAFEYRVQPLLI